MNNKLTLLFAIVILTSLITIVNAESIGEFKLDNDIQIFQTCNNCTYCNFTRVMSSTNQTILSNLIGVQDGTYYYYDVGEDNFSSVGTYKYCYDCGNANEKDTGCLDFDITYTGGEITPQMATLYAISLLFLLFLFILIAFFINKLPSKDMTNETGSVLQISYLKHLRPVLWGVNWGIILAMLFIVSNITIAHLPSLMIGNLFWKFFIIAFSMTMILIPLWFIWLFTNIFRDREFKKMIERGVDLKTL